MEATKICLHDRLVNPLGEGLIGHIRGKQHYPIRRVISVSETGLTLDNGAIIPIRDEKGQVLDYRHLDTVPEKYLVKAEIY